MRLIPVSICHYLASSIDPKKPHTTGKKYKPDIAIARKDVVKYWAKWPMKNINSLQIEIYGVKRINRYSDTLPAVVSSKFRFLILCAMRGQSVIQL